MSVSDFEALAASLPMELRVAALRLWPRVPPAQKHLLADLVKAAGANLPGRLPVEDLTRGLYVHPGSVRVLAATEKRPEGGFGRWTDETVYYVRAEDFMEVQRERDQYRRAVALVNAWRIDPERPEGELVAILSSVGMDEGAARAMAGIVSAVREGRL